MTDAGMPGISDPGERLVRACVERGSRSRWCPGPSAVLTALGALGVPDRPVRVRGLPARGAASTGASAIAALVGEARTVVLYEAPRPSAATLADLLGACGPLREVAVARELTKLHEEVWRGDARRGASGTSELSEPRGEHVIVLAPGAAATRPRATTRSTPTCSAALAEGLSTRDAAARVAATRPPRPLRAPAPTTPQRASAPRRMKPQQIGWMAHHGPTPFYVTTPIYYVNDVPHIGHAYTTVAGRRARPLAPALGRRRRLPHRHRRARPQDPAGGRGAGASPPGAGRPHERAVPRRRGTLLDITYDDFIRTTEPRHHAAVQAVPPGDLRQRRHRARHLRGPLLRRRARRTTPRTSWSTATARSTARPVEHVTEENYFFKLSRFERPAARVLRRASRGGAAGDAAQRGARLHPAGPAATSR